MGGLLDGRINWNYNHLSPQIRLGLSSGLWTKNTAFWARDWGKKKGAVWLRFKEAALRVFGHPKSYPGNSLLVNVSPSKGPSYCSLNLILRLN